MTDLPLVVATDLMGQQLRPGDRIAYATTLGRSAILKVGVIDRIEPRKTSGTFPDGCSIVIKRTFEEVDRVWSWQDPDREIRLRHTSRMLKVP